MTTPEAFDGIIGARFTFELDGVVMAHFQSASGFSNESSMSEWTETGATGNSLTRLVNGPVQTTPITLSRGITSDMELYNWRQQVINGDTENMRRNGSIIMYNDKQEEVIRYNFTDAWPSKWTGPAVSADDNSVALEEIEIVYEFLERAL